MLSAKKQEARQKSDILHQKNTAHGSGKELRLLSRMPIEAIVFPAVPVTHPFQGADQLFIVDVPDVAPRVF